MSLNEGVLDDLQNTPVLDGDVVKVPGTEVQPSASVTVLTGSDVVPNGGSVISEQELAKLPEMDVSFKLIEDGQTKVATLKEVEAEIIGQESMSRSTAQYVKTAFESLLDGPVKLVEFTTQPSRTNFDYVKRHMANSIAKEEQALIGNFELLLGQPTEQLKNAYQQMLVSFIPAIEEQFNDMRAMALSNAEAVLNTKNSVFGYKDSDFIDIATIDLCCSEPRCIKSDTAIQSGVISSMETLGLLLKDPAVQQFIHAVINGADNEQAIAKEFRPVYMGIPTNGKQLLDFYGKDVRSYLDHLKLVCENQFATLNQLTEEVKASMEVAVGFSTPDNVGLTKAMPHMQVSYAVLQRSMKLIHSLSMVNYNAKVFLTFLSKL